MKIYVITTTTEGESNTSVAENIGRKYFSTQESAKLACYKEALEHVEDCDSLKLKWAEHDTDQLLGISDVGIWFYVTKLKEDDK